MRSESRRLRNSRARQLSAVVALLAEHPGEWLPIAGGTDVMVQYAAGKLPARKLVSIWNLPELRRIEVAESEIRDRRGMYLYRLRKHEVRSAGSFRCWQRRAMDRRNRQPESWNHRRQYRERIASCGFLARVARIRSGADFSVGAR